MNLRISFFHGSSSQSLFHLALLDLSARFGITSLYSSHNSFILHIISLGGNEPSLYAQLDFIFTTSQDFCYSMVHFYLATSPSQSLVFLHHRRGLCNTFLHEFGRCCCKFRSFQALFDFEGLGGIVKVVAFIGMGVQCNNFIALSNFAGVAQPGMLSPAAPSILSAQFEPRPVTTTVMALGGT